MYNCEKLARGTSGGFIKCGRDRNTKNINWPSSNIPSSIMSDKRSYFGHAPMFSVQVERDPNRPVGKLYISNK